MRKSSLLVGLALTILPAALAASPAEHARGTYLEARSAQVFIGGCIMSSEADTMGREAVLSWHLDAGTVNGIDLGGLSLVAVVAGDANLGLHREAPRRSVLYVDQDASLVQRRALADLFVSRFGDLFGDVVDIVAGPVDFRHDANGYSVHVGQVVRVAADAMPPRHQNLVSCGEMQWYEPFVPLQRTTTAVAREHAFAGTQLGIRWSDPNGQSAYFGTFSF